jgi:UDP-glucose:glycoprotein glucosyltransferase
LVHYLFEHLAKSELKEYLEEVAKSSAESNESIVDAFKSHYSSLKKNNPSLKLELSEIFNISDSEYITPSINYSNRLQLKLDEEVLFINGKRIEFEGNFQKPLIQNLFQQIPIIMEMASEGEFDNGSIYDIWLNNSQVLNNFNPLLKEDKFEDLDLASSIGDNKDDSGLLNELKFIRSNTDIDSKENDPLTTVWIVGNFESAESNVVIERAIKYLKSDAKSVRLSFVPTNLNGKNNELLYNLINNQDKLAEMPETVEELKNYKLFNKPDDLEVSTCFSRAMAYFNQNSGVNLNENNEDGDSIQLVLDTKKLQVSSEELEFIQFGSIVDYYNTKFKAPLVSRLSNNLNDFSKLSEVEKSNTLIQVSAILNQNLKVHQSLVRFGSYEGQRGALPEINRPQCELNLAYEDEKEDTWANIDFILDPLGDNAAKWSSILNKIRDLDGVKLKGYFSPNSPAGEFKKTHLNRFYRYLLPNNLEFDETSEELKAPKIEFSDLPETSLLTLGLDTMTSWVVMAKDSPHDLDNLKLSSLPSTGTHPEFELKHLLIEGHCTDFDRRPPRGLEFNLGNKENPNMVDTIVMANLGYFQFKANPGVWQMRIRPGKSEDVYELVNIGDQGHSKSGKYVDEGRTLILDSLSGITLFPKVKKRKGMEDVDLLEVKEEKPKTGGGMWDKLFGG